MNFRHTLFRKELPAYRLLLRGISLSPDRLNLRCGEKFPPEAVKIVPSYELSFAGKPLETLDLVPISGIYGTWKTPSQADAAGFSTSEPGTPPLSCTLLLLASEVSGKSATLQLEVGDQAGNDLSPQ